MKILTQEELGKLYSIQSVNKQNKHHNASKANIQTPITSNKQIVSEGREKKKSPQLSV